VTLESNTNLFNFRKHQLLRTLQDFLYSQDPRVQLDELPTDFNLSCDNVRSRCTTLQLTLTLRTEQLAEANALILQTTSAYNSGLEEKDELIFENTQYKLKLEDLQATATRLESTQSELERDLDNERKERRRHQNSLRQTVAQMRVASGVSKQEIRDLEDEVKNLQYTESHLKEAIADLEREVGPLKSTKLQLEGALNTEKETSKRKIDILKREIADLQSTKSQLEGELLHAKQTSKAETETLKEEITALTSTKSHLEVELRAERNEGQMNRANVEALDDKINALTSTKSYLEVELRAERNEGQMNRANVAALNDKITALTSTISHLEVELRAECNEGQINNANVEALNDKITALKSTISHLEVELRTERNEGLVKAARFETVEGEITQLEVALDIERDKNEALANDIQSMSEVSHENMAEIEGQLQEALNHKSALEAQTEHLREQVQIMTQQNTILSRRLAARPTVLEVPRHNVVPILPSASPVSPIGGMGLGNKRLSRTAFSPEKSDPRKKNTSPVETSTRMGRGRGSQPSSGPSSRPNSISYPPISPSMPDSPVYPAATGDCMRLLLIEEMSPNLLDSSAEQLESLMQKSAWTAEVSKSLLELVTEHIKESFDRKKTWFVLSQPLTNQNITCDRHRYWRYPRDKVCEWNETRNGERDYLHACSLCVKKGYLCAVLERTNVLMLLPLRVEDRQDEGAALGKGDQGYWVNR